jgi:hypothetical protein
MQDIEPFYNWRHLYAAEEDPLSPFYGNEYSEFEFTNTIYNYYIHPQWDFFGSRTLFMKLLFVDYEQKFAIIELIGEWNDAIENDIMTLRRNVTDQLFDKGIVKYVIIAENVLNFHSSDDSYYEDWNERLNEEQGWIALVNMPKQSQYDFKKSRLDYYVQIVELDIWRTQKPEFIIARIENQSENRLNF